MVNADMDEESAWPHVAVNRDANVDDIIPANQKLRLTEATAAVRFS